MEETKQPPPASNRAWWTELKDATFYHGVVPSPKKGSWDVMVTLPGNVSD